uniref:Uncharacterized protein n=1 Tax=Lactuca sativa TaxID=4236 RepID=A0A9R1XCL0_LACSA|nr:hypothetical protein LSAT_V11C500275000 [Lactuca sativa]
MEGLSVAMRETCEKGSLTTKWWSIDLSYAMYIRCVVYWRVVQTQHKELSKVFGIGANTQEIVRWENLLGCEPAAFPFIYLGLGVLVGTNMRLHKQWTPIIERFNKKTISLEIKKISLGGRLTLIKSVLENLPIQQV